MATTFSNVLWAQDVEGLPIKMADLVVTAGKTIITYTPEYLAADLPAMSLLASQRIWGHRQVEFSAREAFPVHPRLMSLIPGDGRRNIQRRIYARVLQKQGIPTTPGFDTDWQMALLAGANTIGHFHLFRDDRAAIAWFNKEDNSQLQGKRSTLWRLLREDIALEQVAFDPDEVAQYIGPTPTAGGMIPKLLVSIPDPKEGGWDGTIARAGHPGFIDVLLKIEPADYRDVLVLENLCLDLHAEAGFEVPRHWLREMDGMRLLAVERYDRVDRRPAPQETFRSVIATGNKDFHSNEDVTLEDLPKMVDRLGEVCSIDVKRTKIELYRRFLMAYLTGNGDLHLENLAFVGGEKATRLAPVFDPAPMRAWLQHDVRSAIPIEFGSGETWPMAIRRLGGNYGCTPAQTRDIISKALECTAGYIDRVQTLDIAGLRKDRLSNVVATVRQELENKLDV